MFFDRTAGMTDQRSSGLLDEASAGGTQCFTLKPGAWGIARRRNPHAPVDKVAGWVRTWTAAGHGIPQLLTRPGLDEAPPEFRERDIFDYGVERILVVQHDRPKVERMTAAAGLAIQWSRERVKQILAYDREQPGGRYGLE